MDSGFELRQWASNVHDVIGHLPDEVKSKSEEIWLSQGMVDLQENALGLIWQCKTDTLIYKPTN